MGKNKGLSIIKFLNVKKLSNQKMTINNKQTIIKANRKKERIKKQSLIKKILLKKTQTKIIQTKNKKHMQKLSMKNILHTSQICIKINNHRIVAFNIISRCNNRMEIQEIYKLLLLKTFKNKVVQD